MTTPRDERVIGMKLDQLRHVKRSVGIAGGKQKLSAIHGALQGWLINVLITDRFTAQHLLDGTKAVDAPSVQTPSQLV